MANPLVFRSRRSDPAGLVNPTALTVFVDASIASQPAIVEMPLAQTGEKSLMWSVRAWGRATGGTTVNFQPVLQYGSSATATSNTTVVAPATKAYNSTAGNWFISATFNWDVTSQCINGAYWNYGGGSTLAAAGVLTATQSTTCDLTTTHASYVVAGIFSGSDAGNLCYLDGLELTIMGRPDSQ